MDFSRAVATVSSEGGYLFFGDIFDDYLEYFYMVMEQTEKNKAENYDESGRDIKA